MAPGTPRACFLPLDSVRGSRHRPWRRPARAAATAAGGGGASPEQQLPPPEAAAPLRCPAARSLLQARSPRTAGRSSSPRSKITDEPVDRRSPPLLLPLRSAPALCWHSFRLVLTCMNTSRSCTLWPLREPKLPKPRLPLRRTSPAAGTHLPKKTPPQHTLSTARRRKQQQPPPEVAVNMSSSRRRRRRRLLSQHPRAGCRRRRAPRSRSLKASPSDGG
jgi:hypothetical protein